MGLRHIDDDAFSDVEVEDDMDGYGVDTPDLDDYDLETVDDEPLDFNLDDTFSDDDDDEEF